MSVRLDGQDPDPLGTLDGAGYQMVCRDGSVCRKGDVARVVVGPHAGASGVVHYVSSGGLVSLREVTGSPVMKSYGTSPRRITVKAADIEPAKAAPRRTRRAPR